MKFLDSFKIVPRILIFTMLLSFLPASVWGFGFVTGYVQNQEGQGIEGAIIQTEAVSTSSYADGSYMLAIPAGIYTLTIDATGYQTKSIENVSVVDNATTNLPILLTIADLEIFSAFPTLGLVGENLSVELTGNGFDDTTRLSMSLDVGNIMKIIGSWDQGNVTKIELVGSIAYMADHQTIYAIDISVPESPNLLGKGDDMWLGWPGEIVVSGLIAYISTVSGLTIVNIDPESPGYLTVIGFYDDVVDSPPGLAVQSGRAYLTDRTNKIFKIIDIDPESPTYLTELASVATQQGMPTHVQVHDGIAYLTEEYADSAHGGGLELIDVNPSSPTYMDTLGSYYEQQCEGLVIQNKLAFIATRGQGLIIVDVDPGSQSYLTRIGYAYSFDKAHEVEVSGDIAYVADDSNGLLSIDVSDPTNPEVIGWVDTPGTATDVRIADNKAFVADGGLQVIDISQPEGSSVLGAVVLPERSPGRPDCALSLDVEGNYAYVGSLSNKLSIMDISDPIHPSIVGFAYVGGAPYGLDVSGDRAYVPNGYHHQLKILDVNDPANPTEIGSVDAFDSGYTLDVKISGDFAYVADSSAGLHIIDVNAGSPDYLTIVETVETPISVTYSDAYENRVYFGNANNVYILDIDPASPSYRSIIGNMNSLSGPVAVQEDIMFFTSNNGLFKIVDVSNAANPVELSSLFVESYGSGIVVNGNRAYLGSGEGSILIIDISDLSDPIVVGSVGVPGSPYGLSVKDDVAYVAAFKAGFQMVPLPVEIDPIEIINSTEITATLPSPTAAGHYLLRVFNVDQSDQLVGAVTFTSNLSTLNSKAIIVAGGGPNAPGGIWEETKVAANKAYDVLIQQGYDHESIKYLSLETNNQYVDDAALDVFLYDAIINWASDASELLIYLVDHGETDQFILYATGTYSQKLSAQELDGWLDDLQNSGMDGPVTVVNAACQWGSFVTRLLPPIGKENDRIVLTSASDEPAYFLEQGVESFSFQFWDKILWNEGNLGYAFSNAKELMKGYQTALIDANGNGVSNEDEDLTRASSSIIRRGNPTYITVKPEIDNVTVGDSVLNGGTSTIISATGVVDADSVWAQIIPPDVNPATSSIPITDLPSVELTDGDHDDIYDATYNGFDTEGTYVIIVKALATQEVYSYVAGENTVQNFYSLPVYASVTQSSGVENIEEDSYEEDDSPAQASVIFVNDKNLQAHNFHDTGDEDWVQFFAAAGKTYKIKTSNLSVVTDTIIEVFNGDETPRPEGPYNAAGAGEDEFTDWYCPSNGLYYVKVSNNLTTFGENVRYDLSIYLPVGGGESIAGRVVDTSATPAGIGGVKIEACIGSPSVCETTYTLDNINYLGVFTYGYLVDGTYTLTATKQGYATQIVSVNVGDGGGDGLAVPDIIMPLADTDPPTATVSYSNTNPTNQNVVATLHPSETVTVTNNSGSLIYTFTANGTFTFEFEDSAGNTGTATATVSNIDKTPPTYSIAYTPDTLTNQDVVATLQPSEAVTVTNNGGLLTRTFTTNGSFTFEFTDGAGNTGTAVASVNWIDKTPAVVSISYSISVPTTQDVVATLIPEEAVILTNNGGSTVRTFTTNGSFTFEFTDGAGNTGTAVALVNWIDRTPPTATIAYSTTAPTNQNVVATLQPSETVTVTNNSGLLSYTFFDNGTFTFEFEDAAGNTGSATATVDNIDHTLRNKGMPWLYLLLEEEN